MSHRREQKEPLRPERLERERQAQDAEQRKKMVGYGIGGALAIAVVIVLVVLVAGGGGGGGSDAQAAEVFPEGGSFPEQKVFEVGPAAKAAGCTQRSVKGKGVATHTTSLDQRVKYNTNPPTTGRHYEIPAEDGIYGKAPQDEELVHGMEHGRVIFWVKPTLPEDQRADIRALVDDDTYQMFAATAWNADPAPGGTGRMLMCDEVNDKTFDALAAFRDEHRSQGPEPIP